MTSPWITIVLRYKNGSILIAALQPTFAILHTLTGSWATLPIVTLAWHGSSSKHDSVMLATQTERGDLQVWNIAQAPSTETPKVVRAMRTSNHPMPGAAWLAWSKQGRIVQHSNK